MRQIQSCNHGKSWLLGDSIPCNKCNKGQSTLKARASNDALRMGGKKPLSIKEGKQ